MVIENGKILKYEAYWEWSVYQPDYSSTSKQHQERIVTALSAAVKEQLVADVKVGSFLSGGLDSSLIVAMAQ
jgi:asparagine synthase (glutamine-hydrolysing)